MHIFTILDANRIWSYDQPMMDFAWQLQANCTNASDTGPCYGGKSNEMIKMWIVITFGLEQLLRFFCALQTSRVHPYLDIRTLSMNQFLTIRVLSSDGHYGLRESLCGWTLSCNVINLNQ